VLDRGLDVRMKAAASDLLEVPHEIPPVESVDPVPQRGVRDRDLGVEPPVPSLQHVAEMPFEAPELARMRGIGLAFPESVVALAVPHHGVFVSALAQLELADEPVDRRACLGLHEVRGADGVVDAPPGFAPRVAAEALGALEKHRPVLAQ